MMDISVTMLHILTFGKQELPPILMMGIFASYYNNNNHVITLLTCSLVHYLLYVPTFVKPRNKHIHTVA